MLGRAGVVGLGLASRLLGVLLRTNAGSHRLSRGRIESPTSQLQHYLRSGMNREVQRTSTTHSITMSDVE